MSVPGFDPGIRKSRRCQGGGEAPPRAFNIKAGRRRALMYLHPGLIPVFVRRGDVREEETSPRAFNTGKGRKNTRCVSARLLGPV